MDSTFLVALTALSGLNLVGILTLGFKVGTYTGKTTQEIQTLTTMCGRLESQFATSQAQQIAISKLELQNMSLTQEVRFLRNRTHRNNNLLIAVIGLLEKNPSPLMRRVLDDFTDQETPSNGG